LKKTIITFIAALMAVTAVSCSSNSNVISQEPEVSGYSEEYIAETTIDEEFSKDKEEHRERMREEALDYINITAEPFPECDPVPDDWRKVSYENISLYIPPDVKRTDSETSEKRFCNKDYTKEVSFEGSWEKEVDEMGGPWFPEIDKRAVKDIFNGLGINYDGTYASFRKGVLSYTSENENDRTKDVFDAARIIKYVDLHDTERVYYRQINGLDGYIQKERSENGNEYNAYYVCIIDKDTTYELDIEGETNEEALMMCSTIQFD
jgi:hypothetical protein